MNWLRNSGSGGGTGSSSSNPDSPQPVDAHHAGCEDDSRSVRNRIQELEDENRDLRAAVALKEQNLALMTTIVTASGRSVFDRNETDLLESVHSGTKVLTPEEALSLSLTNLRSQVEAMEDERELFVRQILTLQKKNTELEIQCEAQECKIAVLENLFQQLNAGSSSKAILDDLDSTANMSDCSSDVSHSGDLCEPFQDSML